MGASPAVAEADARKDWLGAPPPRPHVPARGLIFTNPWAWTSPRPPGPSTSPGQHGGPGPKSPLVQPGLSSRLTSLCPQRAAAAGVRPAQVRREAGGGASGGQVNAQVTAGDGRRPPGPPRPRSIRTRRPRRRDVWCFRRPEVVDVVRTVKRRLRPARRLLHCGCSSSDPSDPAACPPSARAAPHGATAEPAIQT